MAELNQLEKRSEIIEIIEPEDEWKLLLIKNLLVEDYYVFYVHETHRSCSRLEDWENVKPAHWSLVLFSTYFYEKLMMLLIEVNTGLSDDDLDDDVRADTSVINIGWCICGTMTRNIDYRNEIGDLVFEGGWKIRF